jgi:hypothetical protein
MSIVNVTLDDQDPEGLMPTHWWGFRMEFAPFERNGQQISGGSWSMSSPGEFWARLLEQALSKMSDPEIQSILDQHWP